MAGALGGVDKFRNTTVVRRGGGKGPGNALPQIDQEVFCNVGCLLVAARRQG